MIGIEFNDQIVKLNSLNSIRNILRLINVNIGVISPIAGDFDSANKETFCTKLHGVLSSMSQMSSNNIENYVEDFLTNNLYAMTIQIHSLADLTAQLIHEINFQDIGNLNIYKVTFSGIKRELEKSGNTAYSDLIAALSCFDMPEFKYFESLSNALKHKFIPVTYQGGYAISGGEAKNGFQVAPFEKLERNAESGEMVEGQFLLDIINKFNLFVKNYTNVLVGLNKLFP